MITLRQGKERVLMTWIGAGHLLVSAPELEDANDILSAQISAAVLDVHYSTDRTRIQRTDHFGWRVHV